MSPPYPSVPQVARLTTSQIAQFKREGFLVLPGVIDPELCRQARDQMWETIAEYRPSMKREDPSTWVPFTEEEQASYERPEDGGESYFSGKGHRFYIRNGAEDLLLDIGARSAWDIAEQLLGKGEVVWPAGLDQSGFTTGPCFLTERIAEGMQVHLGPQSENWTGKSTARTEQLQLPKTGPVWSTGQGTRGMYCTLPGSPVMGPDWRWAHAGEGLYDSRQLLQTAVYFDNLPLGAGGLHLWPRSHTRVWNHWEAMNRIPTSVDKQEGTPRFVGYTDPPIGNIKADTQPVDCYGPAGSVVLWQTYMLHMAGVNTSTDIIRQATLYGFIKTRESLPDERLIAGPNGYIWRNWSDEVRAIEGPDDED